MEALTGPAAPGATEKQTAARGEGGWKDRTACFSCGEKVVRYKRSRVGFRTGESATRFTRGPEESDFDVFLVTGLRNAQVLYVRTYLPTQQPAYYSSPSFCSTARTFLPAISFFFSSFFFFLLLLLPPPIAPSNRIESNSF